MKLRNKKTGEIGNLLPYGDDGRIWVWIGNISNPDYRYNSLAELNEEWEDYEELKGSALDLMILTLTNFIENEPDEDKVNLEDCKQMLERLKAWKRLKDKGFRFVGWSHTPLTHSITGYNLHIKAYTDELANYMKDLDLLFGGEE